MKERGTCGARKRPVCTWVWARHAPQWRHRAAKPVRKVAHATALAAVCCIRSRDGLARGCIDEPAQETCNGDDRFPRPARQAEADAASASFRKVLQQAGKAGVGGKSLVRRRHGVGGKTTGKAARFAPGARAMRRRASRARPDCPCRAASTIKARLVNLQQASARNRTVTHLRYIERDGVDRQGEPGQAYGTCHRRRGPRRLSRNAGRTTGISSASSSRPRTPSNWTDLRTYTRHLMQRMEADLGTRLDWVAVDHWNTDNPHTHVVLRGKDDTRQRPHHRAGLHRPRHARARIGAGHRMAGARAPSVEIQPALAREVDAGALDEPGSHLAA